MAAIARDGAIGQNGGLPWLRLRGDMRWFGAITTAVHPSKMAHHFICYPQTVTIAQSLHVEALRHTEGNAVIMGWKTHKAIGHLLFGRKNIVLRDKTAHGFGEWDCKARTLNEALENAAKMQCSNIFVIGGAQVFREGLQHPDCERLYLTEIDKEYPNAGTWWSERRIAWGAGRMQSEALWMRASMSAYIQEPERPRYRFGVWERV